MGQKLFSSLFVAFGLALGAQGAHAAEAQCKLQEVGQLQVTMQGLRPTVEAKIEGSDVRFLVDSGAFFSMLDTATANRLKLKLQPAPFGMAVRGVAGEATPKLVNVKDFNIAGSRMTKVDFLVLDDAGVGGAEGLLGQNLLGRLDVEYDLANGLIRLFVPEKCDKTPLAYWSPAKYSVLDFKPTTILEPHIVAKGEVNGTPIRVLFDTGAPTSMLTLKAAARAGVKPGDPGVESNGLSGGIGDRLIDTWIAPFKSFAVGGEAISNTRLRFGAMELEEDMLLGADFFLSHRILVSNSQHRLYFTYNGGRVFRLDAPPPTSPNTFAVAGDAMAKGTANAPADAAGYARRAAASAARRDFAPAVADLTRAIELDPKDPAHLRQRAEAYLQIDKPDLALKDLDAALELKPDETAALRSRALLHLARENDEAAAEDFEALVRASPDDDTIRIDIAVAYEHADRLKASIAQYDRWIAEHPAHAKMAIALNGRCWIRALRRIELDAALADCEAALKLEPRSAGIIDSLGLVHFRRGEYKAAVADYDRALRLRPKQAWSHYGRGLAKLKMGDKAGGEADIKLAQQYGPEEIKAAEKLGFKP